MRSAAHQFCSPMCSGVLTPLRGRQRSNRVCLVHGRMHSPCMLQPPLQPPALATGLTPEPQCAGLRWTVQVVRCRPGSVDQSMTPAPARVAQKHSRATHRELKQLHPALGKTHQASITLTRYGSCSRCMLRQVPAMLPSLGGSVRSHTRVSCVVQGRTQAARVDVTAAGGSTTQRGRGIHGPCPHLCGYGAVAPLGVQHLHQAHICDDSHARIAGVAH